MNTEENKTINVTSMEDAIGVENLMEYSYQRGMLVGALCGGAASMFALCAGCLVARIFF